MDEISRTVTADEMHFGGLFTLQEDNMLVITSKPDWAMQLIKGE